jgi:LmbE family N-acetylglucosaminyl deacetylase
VYVVIATDGRLGVNDFSGLEAGEGLVAIRREEMKCAAEKLGVELIHLDYHDQFRAAEGYDGHIPHIRAFLLEMYELVESIQPDVLITWGPDGGSNHMDHRLTGATVTNVYLNRRWEKPSALYYYGTPADQIEDEESSLLRGVDPEYLTTRISYTDEDFEAAFASISCHKSQFQTEGLRERWEKRAGNKVIYLRKFVKPETYSDSLFE